MWQSALLQIPNIYRAACYLWHSRSRTKVFKSFSDLHWLLHAYGVHTHIQANRHTCTHTYKFAICLLAAIIFVEFKGLYIYTIKAIINYSEYNKAGVAWHQISTDSMTLPYVEITAPWYSSGLRLDATANKMYLGYLRVNKPFYVMLFQISLFILCLYSNSPVLILFFPRFFFFSLKTLFPMWGLKPWKITRATSHWSKAHIYSE